MAPKESPRNPQDFNDAQSAPANTAKTDSAILAQATSDVNPDACPCGSICENCAWDLYLKSLSQNL